MIPNYIFELIFPSGSPRSRALILALSASVSGEAILTIVDFLCRIYGVLTETQRSLLEHKVFTFFQRLEGHSSLFTTGLEFCTFEQFERVGWVFRHRSRLKTH